MMLRTKNLLCAGVSAILLFIIGTNPAYAGGSWEPVHVISLKMLSDTDYVLVVAPKMPNNDPYLDKCAKFEVHGTYGFLDGDLFARITGVLPVFNNFYKTVLTKETHLAALKQLKKFAGSDRTVNFGWMGEGFHPLDKKTQCVVESRGLELVEPDDVAVVSYFHAM
jgi:hypothetical protein